MPHIPGHVKGGPSSFGILVPLYGFNHKTETGTEVNLPIGFAPSADIFNLPTSDLSMYSEVVGFLPYLIPWPAGSKKYLVTAAHVIPFNLHDKAHTVINKFKNESAVTAMGKLHKLAHAAKTYSDRIIYNAAASTIEYKDSSMYKSIYRDAKTGMDRTEDQIIEWLALNCVGAEVMGLTSYQSLHGGNAVAAVVAATDMNLKKPEPIVKKKKG